MEWKIGEIKQVNGEWYQCVEQPDYIGDVCKMCSFSGIGNCELDRCSGTYRSDKKSVIFKKLEKIGEPYTLENKKFQKCRVFHTPYIYNKIDCSWQSFADPYYIGLEVKQTKKEVMNIHKVAMNVSDRDYLLDKLESILHDTHCQQYKDEICEAFSKYIATESVSDLKPFDLNAAKAGKPVCTRDGRKARIICFDAKDTQPIIGLYEKNIDGIVREYLCSYHTDGRMYDDQDTGYDLMMLPEKKEGWVNVRRLKSPGDNDFPYVSTLYPTKEEATTNANLDVIDTIKIDWEE